MTEHLLKKTNPLCENAITLIAKPIVLQAIEKKDLSTIQSYVKEGFDVNADLGAATMLTTAVSHDADKIARYLIEQGADMNKKDNLGKTPVEIAIHYANLATLTTLIEMKADMNTLNQEGNLPLHIAAKNAKIKIIDMIAPHTKDLNLLNKEDRTPLMIAAENGYPTTALALIHSGADVNKKNSQGQTALMLASKGNNAYTLNFILKQTLEIDETDNHGWSALHYAADSGNSTSAQVLLSQGANANKHAHRDGATPLILAIKNGHYDVIETLVNNNTNVNEASKYGTPLDYVQGILMRPNLDPEFERNTLHIQKLLRKHGAKTLEGIEKEAKSMQPPFATPVAKAFSKPMVLVYLNSQNQK